ncbi:hypothetical protein F2Q69_00043492 [Brassica cretica]|uniref:Uncharacterized protein n=1 Tax=Brassica cretica TaxID=69181 RepID=A0A8S9NUL7_BRACR|nr:hypothetical protein F2Q69_00043492 [Brassica cretica]
MRSGRHKATSPSRNWVASWRPVPCRTGSPAGDRSLAARGSQLATGSLQDAVATGRHLATVFHKLRSPDWRAHTTIYQTPCIIVFLP